jgi:hypothetical protein
MTEKLFDPIPVAYRGLYADDHLVDAQQFGVSIASAAQIANSICHQFFFEGATHNPRIFSIRFFVGASTENGLIQQIFAIMNQGQLPVFAPILLRTGKQFIEFAFDAIISKVLKKQSELSKAIDQIHDLAAKHQEFVSQVHHGHMRDKKWLQTLIDRLTTENRTPLRELPAPVGRTVRIMQIGTSQQAPLIDEPSAEVLRSPDAMRVGDAAEYEVKIVGVFKTNGTSRIKLLCDDKIVPGKIIDPVVDQPNNVYTTALNADRPLRVTAKPTFKDGKLHKLFISDAKLIKPPRKSSRKQT